MALEHREKVFIAHAGILDKLDNANQAILNLVRNVQGPEHVSGQHVIMERIQDITINGDLSPDRSKTLALYYRQLYEEKYEVTEAHTTHDPEYFAIFSKEASRMIQRALHGLMQRHLVLDRSFHGAGQGTFDYFLCAEVKDKDLRWDLTETEW